jgi:uncharacterized protein
VSDEPAPADPVIAAFEQVARRLWGFDENLDPERIDGFLAALAATWREIGIDEWLGPLAGEAFGRTFADPADQAQARAALVGRYRQLRRQLDAEALLADPEHLRLLPYLLDDEQIGQGWSSGFLQAAAAFESDWPAPDPDDPDRRNFEDLLTAVIALGLPDDAPGRVAEWRARLWPKEPPSREQVMDEAFYCVQELRLWWLDHHPMPETRRVAAQPGRNEPCWCGSGKKFKRCHGSAL